MSSPLLRILALPTLIGVLFPVAAVTSAQDATPMATPGAALAVPLIDAAGDAVGLASLKRRAPLPTTPSAKGQPLSPMRTARPSLSMPEWTT